MIGLTGQPFGWGRDQTGKGTVPLSDLLGLPGWQVVTWTSPCVVKKASSFGLRFPTDGDINHLFPIGSCFFTRRTERGVCTLIYPPMTIKHFKTNVLQPRLMQKLQNLFFVYFYFYFIFLPFTRFWGFDFN